MTNLSLHDNSVEDLQIIDLNGEFVVDSRLIANRLDIEHESFMRTIKKHESKIEQRFGIIRFEIGRSEPNANGAVHNTKFALLTENQATALMTFSKNTDSVIECKLDLVDAFSKAKEVIKTVIPAQQEKIRELELMVRLREAEATVATANKQLMDTRHSIIQLHGSESLATSLILGATVVQVENIVEKVIDRSSGRIYDGIGITEVAKRLGFRKTQECWQWLESIGYGKDTEAWEIQLSAVEHPKLKREALDDIIGLWNQGKRQRLIGEN
jgi:anti-repressor protein